MIESALVVLKAFNHIQTTRIRENLNGKVKSLAEVELKIQILLAEQQNKIQAIVKVLKYAEGVLKKDSSPEQVCGYFFRVTARPTILLVSDIAKYSAGQINPLATEISTIENWSRSRDRSLGTEAAIDNLFIIESSLRDIFTADSVIMKPSDNMFSAYDGAKGTTLGQLNPGVIPMTFDSLFP